MPLVGTDEWRIVELAHAIVAGGANIKVESPVDMMVVDIAHTRALNRGEREPWADCAVGVQPPLTDVAVPTGLQFAYKHDLVEQNIDADTKEVSGIRSGVYDRQGRRRAEAEARRDIGAGRLNHPLLVLPVAIRPTGIAVVLDVQNRHVRTIQNPFALVVDVAQLNAGTVGSTRSSRPHRKKAPERLPSLGHRHPYLPGGTFCGRGLVGAVRYAAQAPVARTGVGRQVLFEADDPLTREVNGNDLMLRVAAARQQPDRNAALDAAIRQFVQRERWNRLVGLDLLRVERRGKRRIATEHLHGCGKFFI